MKIEKIHILITLSISVLILDYFGTFNFIKAPVDRGIIPVKRGIFTITTNVKDVFAVAANYAEVLKFYREKEALVKKSEELQVQLREIENENRKLRIQLEAPFPPSYKFVPARTLAVGKFLEIDQGENEGVKKGQIAVDGQTLVGIVKAVSPERSTIKLVSDPDFQIAAITERDAKGIVTGLGEGNVNLTRVLQKDPLFLNDQVVTAGAEFVPPNLLIGKITHITQEEAATYKQAKIAPVIDYTREKIVFVITSL